MLFNFSPKHQIHLYRFDTRIKTPEPEICWHRYCLFQIFCHSRWVPVTFNISSLPVQPSVDDDVTDGGSDVIYIIRWSWSRCCFWRHFYSFISVLEQPSLRSQRARMNRKPKNCSKSSSGNSWVSFISFAMKKKYSFCLRPPIMTEILCFKDNYSLLQLLAY